jgi:hypothetical protein
MRIRRSLPRRRDDQLTVGAGFDLWQGVAGNGQFPAGSRTFGSVAVT